LGLDQVHLLNSALHQSCKVAIKFLVAVLVLQGAQDGVFWMGIGGGDERLKGAGREPGILIQEVNVVVAVVDGILHAEVIGRCKAQVVGAAHQSGLGEICRNKIGRPVRRVVVPDI